VMAAVGCDSTGLLGMSGTVTMGSNRAPTRTLSHESAAVDRWLLTVLRPSVEWPSEADFEFSRQR
jgi:hypothetical protein